VVRFGPRNIWVGPGPVAVHGCAFWAQKTGLNRTLKHYEHGISRELEGYNRMRMLMKNDGDHPQTSTSQVDEVESVVEVEFFLLVNE
jgi:hypothetical protein